MSIGTKNRFVTINKRSATVDGANESIGWVMHKQTWGDIAGQNGMARIKAEASAGGINTDLQRYSIRIGYDLSIDNTMQVVHNGVQYDIQSVSHDHARRRDTYLICQVGGSRG